LVVAGSLGKSGAAVMAGYAALRGGAGLVTVATPDAVLSIVASAHPEYMTEPLAANAAGTASLQNLAHNRFSQIEEGKSVLALGPGLGLHAETQEFIRKVVAQTELPVVLDADGLNAFAGNADALRQRRTKFLAITPHPGEMARLTGLTIAEIQANRLEVARNFAREHELIVVLKGHRTLIAAPDGTVWVNPTGNPGMATGGTGDILTGMVAGLIAQHPQRALEATALAVYLHGLAGDLASESVGENSLVATDLVRFLPQAFAQTRNQKSEEIRLHA